MVPRDTIEGKAAYTVKVNHLMILTDSMIVCHLAESIWGLIEIRQHVVDILNKVTGMDMTVAEAEETAERIWNVMRAFAVREGTAPGRRHAAQALSHRAHPRRPVKGHGHDRGDA